MADKKLQIGTVMLVKYKILLTTLLLVFGSPQDAKDQLQSL